VYGFRNLKKTDPVLQFLSRENKTKSLHFYKDGLAVLFIQQLTHLSRFEEFQKKYPYLCTASVRAGGKKVYPSVLIHGLLYLGSWADASNLDRLKEINVRR